MKMRDPIDAHVGARMRLRRTELGVSLEKLAGALGTTVPQIENWEMGAAHIGASQLLQVTEILGVGPMFFFTDARVEDLDSETE